MFPGVYGFTWDPGNLIFLGVFYTVVLVIFGTVTLAAVRSMKDFKARKNDSIRWKLDFDDLPERDRTCRHEFTGEFKQRTCETGFDCRECPEHAKLVAAPHAKIALTDEGDDEEGRILGFDMPLDRLYHRGHTWVKAESDGAVTVGFDDFGSHLIGRPDQVELPAAGNPLHVNGTAWHIKKNGSDLRILSPVEGRVVETGSAEAGWYLKVRPLGKKVDTQHLLRGAEVRPWLAREMERLELSLAADGVGLSLADGGAMMEDISKEYPSVNWDSVWGEMFLEP
jgi:glycine cleavage system H lipoate-binding protein